MAQNAGPPFFDYAEGGYRYKKCQGLAHFCLLCAVRIVSALSASVELARGGYAQEIGVLLRTVIEYYTQIDFMFASTDDSGTLSEEAQTFLSGYFSDSHRGNEQTSKKVELVQKKVHDTIGGRLEKSSPASKEGKCPTQMLSNIYMVFSNYVHGRYPETMDLYGGQSPGRFHLAGMSGTPKDDENLQVLATLIDSASLCFVGIVQHCGLRSIVESDEMLARW